MRKKILIAAILFVGMVLAAGSVWLLNREPEVPRQLSVQDLFAEPGTSGAALSPQEMANLKGDGAHKVRTVLADFKEWSRFPPDSRPISDQHRDVIDFDVVATVPIRLVGEGPDGKLAGRSPYSCMLQPEKSAFTEGEMIRVFLSCGNRDRRAPLNMLGHRLVRRVLEKRTNIPPAAATINDRGENGDARASDQLYTFAYKPQKGDWGDMVLAVDFEFSEEKEAGRQRKYTLETSFFSSPVAPARFTGRVNDMIQNGSLVFEVEVQVRRPGSYEIYGNLRNASEWLATAKYTGQLKAGTQTIRLRYFGLIFHEKDADGPYFLEGLRGLRNNDPVTPAVLTQAPEKVAEFMSKLQETGYTEPLREIMPPHLQRHTTRDYARSAFSKQEWDSPYRRDRIKELMSMDM